MFWKFTIPVSKILFLDTDPATMLIINQNREMQRLYCSVDKNELKKVSQKKNEASQQRTSNLITKIDKKVKMDYSFIEAGQVKDSKTTRESRKATLDKNLQDAVND